VKTIDHGATTYRIPFDHLFRPLTPDEAAGLRASVEANGVLAPVLTYDSPAHGPDCVIDGANRAALAAEFDADLPVRKLRGLTDEAAEALAESLNADRRHLTPEEQRERRAERVKRVAGKRAEGKSLRTIAEEEGVSPEQVRQDVKDATVKGLTVEPEKVMGRDGKERPAARKPAPDTPAAPEPPAPPDPKPAAVVPPPAVDAWGIPVQPHAAEAFAAVPEFKRLAGLLREVRGAVTALAESPGGRHLLRQCQFHQAGKDRPGRWALAHLDNAIRVIEDAAPRHTDCPYQFNPDQPHPGPDDTTARPCPLCDNRRFTGTLKQFQVPPGLVAAMKAHYGVTGGD
jgi:DNA-binding CsgD family transcriptional regulator